MMIWLPEATQNKQRQQPLDMRSSRAPDSGGVGESVGGEEFFRKKKKGVSPYGCLPITEAAF